MLVDNEIHYQFCFSKVMIFRNKLNGYKGLWAFNSGNLTLVFSMNGGTFPSGSEVLGSCYLRLVVGIVSMIGENLTRSQPDRNFTI